jgi:type VI secretion system protein VasD
MKIKGQNMWSKLPQAVVVLLLLTTLSACQSNKSLVGEYFDLDTDLKIEFIVDSDINQDELGIASPLFIRLYELKSEKMMKKADFIDIYEKDKEALGADMVGEAHKLKRFTPGQNRIESFVLDKDTQYVALYAEFFDFKESRFKLIFPVVANNVFRNSIKIRVSGNQLLFNSPADDPQHNSTN